MKRFFNLKDFGVAFSLSVLWFVKRLNEAQQDGNFHYFAFELSDTKYLAIFLNVLVLAAVFLLLLKLQELVSERKLKLLLQISFLCLALASFGALSSAVIKWLSPETIYFINFPLPFLVLCLCAAFSFRENFSFSRIVDNLKLLSLVLLPFGALLCLQAGRTVYRVSSISFSNNTVEKSAPDERRSPFSKKVIWIIFDELDRATVVSAARNGIELADLRRLAEQSFTAENAFAPNALTRNSIHALVTGVPLERSQIIAANDLLLYPADGSAPFNLRESNNVFSEVAALGGRSGIAGWYHPYPRIFSEHIAYGYWSSEEFRQCSQTVNCAIDNFRASFSNVPLMNRMFPDLIGNFRNRQRRRAQGERHRFLSEKAVELAARPDLDLLFFHFSVPHAPFIARGELDGRETYFSSLEAVNDTVRRIRETLERSGEWERTVLIVSSDHWWRNKQAAEYGYLPEAERRRALEDIRVPFVVRFPGQASRARYGAPFNTIVTKELILAILKDEIRDETQLAAWLETLRRRRPELVDLPSNRDH